MAEVVINKRNKKERKPCVREDETNDRIRAINEIVNQLIDHFDKNIPINLSNLKCQVCAKYKLS